MAKRDENDLDLRQNFLSVDKKIAMDSFGNFYKIGQTVGHEGSEVEDEIAEIISFEVDEVSKEVLARTTKGYAHIDFFYIPGKFEPMDIIGKTKEQGIHLLMINNNKYRVISEDDNTFIVTCDYCPDRVNLTIKKGIIISINFG